ncbi:Mu-like prophage major head subunit gpT family protein [Sedimentitalea sp. JM2-8]|uniref:Mu-like prophage major head subunit gpT family protein n=1 Tax=Sedimentitalea xiamensis TaxID=3050037 RepID=A0ABT7FLE6_9RHOB|nr:Mu-like prophage major head subunit gpT family protein [Sedimentitalea xiamensis]MDK3075927.1 Mu-like prophage major head subunit gpT family protein [Sedimentitalea xiamensis]
MLVNEHSLDLVFRGFKSVYSDAYLQATVHKDKIAMTVPSSGRDETYSWIGQFPHLREWIGPRHVHNLKAHSFTIVNRRFESIVAVMRDAISDDKPGVFKPAFSEMGYLARNHPEEMVFGLLAAGFETPCFDGQNFFDADHPQMDGEGNEVSVSNFQDGAGDAWYLPDTSRAVRPLIWQEREDYEFQSLTSSTDSHVFMNDEYVYGVRARVNAGFGLWQLGFGSKATLDRANYAAARAAMMNFRSDGGRIPGIAPTIMVVPPSLEDAALHLLNTEAATGGASNPWKGTAELIVTPFVAG